MEEDGHLQLDELKANVKKDGAKDTPCWVILGADRVTQNSRNRASAAVVELSPISCRATYLVLQP